MECGMEYGICPQYTQLIKGKNVTTPTLTDLPYCSSFNIVTQKSWMYDCVLDVLSSLTTGDKVFENGVNCVLI